jgi:hypothetical protein
MGICARVDKLTSRKSRESRKKLTYRDIMTQVSL